MYRRRLINRTRIPVQIRIEPGTKPPKLSGNVQLIQDVAPPLSLQDLCLLRVINDVDSYPVELLSSLPHWLRNLLLSSLPVLDLCRLEHTAVARGVDIDKVWTARVQVDGMPELRSSVPRQRSCMLDVRPAYTESLFQMNNHLRVMENDATLKTEMDKAFQGLYDHYGKGKFMTDKEEYLVKLATQALSGSDIRNVAHSLASIRGPLLSKQLQVTEKNIWDTQATSLAVLGMKYENLQGTEHGQRVDVFLTPHRLLPICENTDSIKLLSLLTNKCKIRPITVCLNIDLISQSFLEKIEAEKIILDNGLNVAVNPDQTSCLSIMKCLLEEVVILRVTSKRCPYITGPMIALIEAAVDYGKLRSLFCIIPNLYMETVQVFSSLFHMKTFHMLHLRLSDFSTQAMIKLIQAFMTAPCKTAQSLVINTRFLSNKRKPPVLTSQQIATLDVGTATVPVCAVHHKTIQSNLSDHIILYLLLLPCVRLTELSLDYSTSETSLYQLCMCHPNLHVKKITLDMSKHSNLVNIMKPLDTTTIKEFETLLNKPSLEELVLTGDWMGRKEAKKGLIQGLQQQKVKPELQLKSLTLNMLGYSDEEMRMLQEVIVSFPEGRRPRVYPEGVFTDAAKKHRHSISRTHS